MAMAPFTLLEPEEIAAPFVFAVPHSGRCYPDDMRDKSALSDLALRSSEDAYVDELFDFVPALGAPTIIANYARAYVDLNRAPDEVDTSLFDWAGGPIPDGFRRTHRVRAGLGVIPRYVSNSNAIYNAQLPADQIEYRLNTVYHPYHQKISALLDQVKQEFGFAILIDCHSMPSPDPVLGFRRPGPDIVIGDSWGSSADRALTSRVESLFRQFGYSARRNLPYAGGFATTHYGKPRNQVHALQIELSRGLYMNEQTMTKKTRFRKLQLDLKALTTRLLSSVAETQMAAE